MGKFFLLVFLVILNAFGTDYPKIYSSLGNQLFDANRQFEPFLDDSHIGTKVQDFHRLSEEIRLRGIYLDSQQMSNPSEQQHYLLSLRELKKKHQEISYLLRQKLLQSMENNNYEAFCSLFTIIADDIMIRTNLRGEVLTYYRQNRHVKAIPVLEEIIHSASTLKKEEKKLLNEFYTLKSYEETSMWQDNADVSTIKLTWNNAIKYCQNLNLGGYDDWMLPDKTDLFDFFFSRPELNYHAEDLYWSSSEESDTTAYRVYFNYTGSVSQASNITSHLKSEKWFVRCYRRVR